MWHPDAAEYDYTLAAYHNFGNFRSQTISKISFHMLYILCTLILQLHLDKYRTIYTLTVHHFILSTHLRTSNQLLQAVPPTSHAYMGIQALR